MIFGSAFPMMPVDRCLDEIAALPLKDEVRRKWMHDNAPASSASTERAGRATNG